AAPSASQPSRLCRTCRLWAPCRPWAAWRPSRPSRALSVRCRPYSFTCSSVHDFLVGLEEAHLAAIGERAETHAVALLRCRVPQHHVREVDRGLFLDDAALHVALRVRLRVTLHHVDAFDDHVLVVDEFDDGAAAALVTAGNHEHFVALAN